MPVAFQPQGPDLTFEVRLGYRETFTDDAPGVFIVMEQSWHQFGQIDPALIGPVDYGFLQSFSPHYGAVDFLFGKASEKFDQVLVGNLEGFDRGLLLFFEEAAQGFGSGDR